MVGPVFAKIWDTPESGYSERMNHLIEPTLAVEYAPRGRGPRAAENGRVQDRLGAPRRFARGPLLLDGRDRASRSS